MIFVSGRASLMHFAGAGERAARAPARDEMVEALADEVLQDFRAGRVAVIGRIRRILELAREEPAMFLRELGGLAHHALAAFGGGREDHLRAEHAHDLAALDREGFDHHGDERITLRGAHHRERDAGVARRRFDDRLARLQRAAFLRVLDDRDREAILDRRERIEELALHVHRRAGRREAVDADDGSAADGAENVVVDHGAATLGVCQ